MRTADLLSELSLQQVKDVARRLGFPPGSLSKSELVRGLAVSLANRRDANGQPFGWLRGMQTMLDALTHEELLRVVTGEWCGADGIAYETRPSIERVSADALRDLVFLLAMAEDEDRAVTTTQVVNAPGYEQFFTRIDDSKEPESEADGQDGPAWHHEAVIELKTGGLLPDGLQRRPERQLLPHQQRALEHVLRWGRGGARGGVLCMPTGSGKTVTAARVVTRMALQPGTTVLWLAHRSELIDQAVETLAHDAAHLNRSVRIGRFQGGALKARSPVDIVVASVPSLWRGDSLGRLLETQHPVGLVVVDECHHAAAREWAKLLRRLSDRNVRLLGLSATPTRTVEEERSTLWRFFPDMIYEVPAAELIHAGVLAQPSFEFVATEEKFKATSKQRAEFERFKDLPKSLVTTIAETHGRNERIVAHYVRSGGPSHFGPTLVFAFTIVQAKAIAMLLDRAGVHALAISSEDSDDERRRAIARFKDGKIQVLVNVSLFTEGTDLPGVATVVIARPTTSPILFAQMVGRGLRGREVNGTEACNVVVFHDEVIGLAAGHLATCYTDDREARIAMGFEEEPPSRAERIDAPPLSARARAQLENAPTRDEEALRSRMHALLAALAGSAHLGLSPDAVALPLMGWWRLQAEGRCRYVPVFAPDERALRGTMEALALHIDGNASRPSVPTLRCLPDSYVERFIDKAARAKVRPIFVPIHEAPARTQQHFARAILEGGSTWIETAAPWGGADAQRAWLELSAGDAPKAVPDVSPTVPPPTIQDMRPPTMPPAETRTESASTAPVPVRKVVNTMPIAVYQPASDRRSELRLILQRAVGLPHDERKAMLEAVHRERFTAQYPTLVDFVLALMPDASS